MQIVVANNATMAVSSYVSYMKQQGFNKNNLIKSKNAMLRFVNGFINRAISGKTDDEPVWRTCYWRDGYTPMTWYFTFYVLPQQDLVLIVSFYSQEGSPNVNENRQVVRLNESQLRRMIEECLICVLTENNKKTVGEYTVINGSPWGGHPHGLEHKGKVIDVRMYDRNGEEYKENFETYGLFRRVDNMKFFYAKIVPIEGTKETKWVEITRKDVPKIILDDFKTINPQEHEPFLPF